MSGADVAGAGVSLAANVGVQVAVEGINVFVEASTTTASGIWYTVGGCVMASAGGAALDVHPTINQAQHSVVKNSR